MRACSRFAATLLFAVPWLLSGCDCEGDSPRCVSDVECPAGEACLDGTCVPRMSDAGGLDAGADAGAPPLCPAARVCGGPVICCHEGQE